MKDPLSCPIFALLKMKSLKIGKMGGKVIKIKKNVTDISNIMLVGPKKEYYMGSESQNSTNYAMYDQPGQSRFDALESTVMFCSYLNKMNN